MKIEILNGKEYDGRPNEVDENGRDYLIVSADGEIYCIAECTEQKQWDVHVERSYLEWRWVGHGASLQECLELIAHP